MTQSKSARRRIIAAAAIGLVICGLLVTLPSATIAAPLRGGAAMNDCLTGTATATSTQAGVTATASATPDVGLISAAYDDNIGTIGYCRTAGYLVYDFGQTISLRSARVYSLHGYNGGLAPTRLTFEVSSNGSTWTQAGTVAPRQPFFPGSVINARFIRFGGGASGWGASEFYVNDLPLKQNTPDVTPTATATPTGLPAKPAGWLEFADCNDYKRALNVSPPVDPVTNASDGSRVTFYRCGGAGAVGFDFGGPLTINNVSVSDIASVDGSQPLSTGFPYFGNFFFDVSRDNVTWTTVLTLTATITNTTTTVSLPSAVTARYARFAVGELQSATTTSYFGWWFYANANTWRVSDLKINGATFPSLSGGAPPTPPPSHGVFWQKCNTYPGVVGNSGVIPAVRKEAPEHLYLLKSSDGDLLTYYLCISSNGDNIVYEYDGQVDFASVSVGDLTGWCQRTFECREAPAYMTIALSDDGQNWLTLGTVADSATMTIDPPERARYIRFMPQLVSSEWGVNELLVNGVTLPEVDVAATPTPTPTANCPAAGTATPTGTPQVVCPTSTPTPTETRTATASATDGGGGGGSGGQTATAGAQQTATAAANQTATSQPTFTSAPPTNTATTQPTFTPSATATVANPVPFIFTVAPPSANPGDPGMWIAISGSGFVPSSVVRWDGGARSTTFVSDEEVQAFITSTAWPTPAKRP